MGSLCKRLLVVFLLVPAVARAGGLEYPDNGAQALGRGGAFVARADDGSAFWHNPAGLAKLGGFNFYLSGNLSFHTLKFDRDGNYPMTGNTPAAAWEGQPYPEVKSSGAFLAPMAAFTAGIGKKLTVGIGLGGPSGIGSHEYPEFVTVNGDAKTPAPQRYDTVSADTKVFFITIPAAYRVSPKLDVGAGFMWGIGLFNNVNYTWGTRNPGEDPGQDAKTTLNAHDYFIPAFNLGLLFRPSPKLEVGAAFRMGASVHATGEVEGIFGQTLQMTGTKLRPRSPCKIDEAETPDTACAEIDAKLPPVLRAGARYIFRDPLGHERGDVELDLSAEFWSAFDAYTVHADGVTPIEIEDQKVEHNYKNTFGLRVGGSYGFGKISARGGVAFDTAASPKEWSRLDASSWAKLTLGYGASYTLRGAIIDLSGAYVIDFAPTVDPGTGQVRPLLPVESYPPPAPSPNPVNEGKYSSNAFIFGLGVRLAFSEYAGGSKAGSSFRDPYVTPPEPAEPRIPVGDQRGRFRKSLSTRSALLSSTVNPTAKP